MMRLPALIGLLLFTTGIHAQLQIGSLEELLNYADENAVTAKQAKLQPGIAAEDIRLQASGLYPRINAFAAGDYYPLLPTQLIPAEILGGAAGTYYKAQFGLPYTFAAGAELNMPVINLEKWSQLARLRKQYEQAQWNSKAALEQFHIQLIEAYYQSLVTKEVLKLNHENEETVNELYRIMNERFNAGIINPADLNRTKNLQADVQTSGFNYQRNLQQSINNLNSLLNAGKDPISLSETLTSFDWKLIPRVSEAATRAGWQESGLKVSVAEMALNETKKAALPKLALNGRYAYNMQSKFESGTNNVTFNTGNIGLRMDFPLFQGNYYRSMQHKSHLQLEASKLEQELVQATLSQQQKDWFEQYTAAYQKHFVLDQKIKTASDNLRIARLNIKEGLMEFDEFNNIFMEYNRAQMEYIQNLADGILYYLLSTQKF